MSDQPKQVEHAVGGFTEALVEAVIIVLAVSFISLGIRAGLVVSVSIPLVLAIVFVIMQIMDVTLQRISLGALIIALGLLVVYLAAYAHVATLGMGQAKLRTELRQKRLENEKLKAALAASPSCSG